MQRVFSSFLSPLSLIVFGCVIPTTVTAQVSTDGTTSTTVNQEGNNFTIEQGDRAGDNLFHSFDEFSVPTLGSAVFNNAGDIANIFSRVTGSNISNIDGLLSANGSANLYLINPNGIIFGENASLNLGGSFFASTADSLLFEGGEEFSVSNPQAAPLLEVNIPIGARFRDNPGDIINRSFFQNSAGEFVGLEVVPGKNLTLLGGNINFEAGEAKASGGNINLGSLSDEGIADLDEDISLKFPENIKRGNVNLSNGADVDVRGIDGGNININAANVELTAGGNFGFAQLRAGILSNSTIVNAQAGNININVTENLTLDEARIFNFIEPGALGNGGGFEIVATNLILTNGAQMSVGSFSEGNGGTVSINAQEKIQLSNVGFISSTVELAAQGNGGKLNITGKNLILDNGSQISATTFGEGNSGVISLNVTELISLDIFSGIFNTVEVEALGNSGELNIVTKKLMLTNSSQIDVSTFGAGNSGEIVINASELVTVDGLSEESGIASAIFSTVERGASGSGGELNIFTPKLNLINGGVISASSFGRSDGGFISVQADMLYLDSGSIGAANFPTESQVAPTGGNIFLILENDLIARNNSTISAEAGSNANGGNITINADDGFILAFPNQNNDIIANAAQGSGGNININTQALFGIEERLSTPPNQTNDIDASSEFGLQGDFSLSTPDFDPTNGLINLPASVGDASDQISQNPCQQGVGSEFRITGKGGLPPTVNEALNSEETEVGLIEAVPSQRRTGNANNISADNPTPEATPAMGWVFNDRGEVTLTAHANTNTNIKRSPQQASSSCSASSLQNR